MKGENHMEPMEMLDRYIYDVGRRLPSKQREDIEKELKSLLLDALEARIGDAEPTEADMAAVLKEFGSPDDVAARYAGEKFVIGPKLYPFYRMVLWIVIGALALGLFVSSFVGYAFAPAATGSIGSHVLQFLASFVSSVWGAVGVVTVVFWGIERGITRRGGKAGSDEPWEPKKLPPVPKSKDAWKPADSIVTIVFTVIALVLFNAMPGLVAFYAQDAPGQWASVPVHAQQALDAYLPLWNIGWALSLALHALVLARGRWRLGTRIADIVLHLYDIVVVAVMMSGPALLNTEVMIGGSNTVIKILQAQFVWVFVVIIIASVVEVVKISIRIVKDRA